MGDDCQLNHDIRFPRSKSGLGNVWLPALLIISRIKRDIVHLERIKGADSRVIRPKIS